jgi:methionine synthase I (cobalamin-dependent)
MRTTLAELLAAGGPLLADGATGTNLFRAGLESGYPPELWNLEHPDRIRALHQSFVDAGAQIILTNTFGGTRNRLALHGAQDRVHEIVSAAARLATDVAAGAAHPVVVAGSVGPTGELFEPLGALTHDDAVSSFREQIDALVDGGVDVIWIETMSAVEEIRAAATAAIDAGMPYTVTCSFDTAGRTMMGLAPGELHRVFEGTDTGPIAHGGNCGVGASDLLAATLAMVAAAPTANIIAKANCGVPRFEGADIVYTGTTDLMGEYARLAADAGAAIIGGCCGTSPDHLAAMRHALAARTPGEPPDLDAIIAITGPLTNSVASDTVPGGTRRASRRRG